MGIGIIRNIGNVVEKVRDLFFHSNDPSKPQLPWTKGTTFSCVAGYTSEDSASETTYTQNGYKVKGQNTFKITLSTSMASNWRGSVGGSVRLGTTPNGINVMNQSWEGTGTRSFTLNISAYEGQTLYCSVYIWSDNDSDGHTTTNTTTIGDAYLTYVK